MPFRFLFGRRKQENGAVPKDTWKEDDLLSMTESMMEEEYDDDDDDVIEDVYFMNPAFNTASGNNPNARHPKRQFSRRSSSRIREHKHQCSISSIGEVGVDVLMAPSSFAFHTIPNDPGRTSVCSRDDSEIATRTYLDCYTPDGRSSVSSCMQNPHINATYLNEWRDDSEIGSCTLDKIPLRHMGSAMSYRLSIAGTPDCSICGDDDMSMSGKPGHRRRHSDMSDNLNGVRERHKMIRLESIIGKVKTNSDGLYEFGVINPELFGMCDATTAPGMFKSASAELPDRLTLNTQLQHQELDEHVMSPTVMSTQLNSYPLILTNIIEEDEEESQTVLGIEETNKIEEVTKVDSFDQWLDHPEERVYESSYTITKEPEELPTDSGFTNPFYGAEEEGTSPFAAEADERRALKKSGSIKFSKKRREKKRREGEVELPRRKCKDKRDESLHVALMERYLVQSVVNKYMCD